MACPWRGNRARGKPARLSCVVTIFHESCKAISLVRPDRERSIGRSLFSLGGVDVLPGQRFVEGVGFGTGKCGEDEGCGREVDRQSLHGCGLEAIVVFIGGNEERLVEIAGRYCWPDRRWHRAGLRSFR